MFKCELEKLQKIETRFIENMGHHGFAPCPKVSGAAHRDTACFSGALCGSAFEPRPIAVLGINWGGGGVRDKGFRYPWNTAKELASLYAGIGCGLADDYDSDAFGEQVRLILGAALNGNVDDVLRRHVFWTNRMLVRSPTVEKLPEDLRTAALEASSIPVMDMLKAVNPSLVLCFGSSGDSPAELILGKMCNNRDWGRMEPTFKDGKCHVRVFEGIERDILPRLTTVWVFPHPARGKAKVIASMKTAMMRLGNDVKKATAITTAPP